jgi:diacylglycerol kinase (ATP)
MSSDPSHAHQPTPRRPAGLNRIWHAAGYSIEGLRPAGTKPRFARKPWQRWYWFRWPSGWAQLGRGALLAGSVVIVMIVELLNTGIETAIDRIGPEWHDLSKRAKDMGSAAVLLALLLCGGHLGSRYLQRIFHG